MTVDIRATGFYDDSLKTFSITLSRCLKNSLVKFDRSFETPSDLQLQNATSSHVQLDWQDQAGDANHDVQYYEVYWKHDFEPYLQFLGKAFEKFFQTNHSWAEAIENTYVVKAQLTNNRSTFFSPPAWVDDSATSVINMKVNDQEKLLHTNAACNQAPNAASVNQVTDTTAMESTNIEYIEGILGVVSAATKNQPAILLVPLYLTFRVINAPIQLFLACPSFTTDSTFNDHPPPFQENVSINVATIAHVPELGSTIALSFVLWRIGKNTVNAVKNWWEGAPPVPQLDKSEIGEHFALLKWQLDQICLLEERTFKKPQILKWLNWQIENLQDIEEWIAQARTKEELNDIMQHIESIEQELNELPYNKSTFHDTSFSNCRQHGFFSFDHTATEHLAAHSTLQPG